MNQPNNRVADRIRVRVRSVDDQFIHAFEDVNPTGNSLLISHHASGINEAFSATVEQMWIGAQLNLIDVEIDEKGVYYPKMIVLEPDYLIDISSLAECMKDYGRHPLNYIRAKFEPVQNTKHILLGNVANLFFDELVYELPDSALDYHSAMKMAFQTAPFEFSTCEEINRDFFAATQVHFQNIRKVINFVFPDNNIDRNKALVEPAFMCEQLGVQGRLDFLQNDPDDETNRVVIELKSGKAPWPESNPRLTGLNHRTQLFLYQIVLQKVLGYDFDTLKSFLFYSKYTDTDFSLRNPGPDREAIKEALNLRNLIVANEKRIADDPQASRMLIDAIIARNLITDKPLTNKFIAQYIIPQIQQFAAVFQSAGEIELEYFHSFYSFITKEHFISKTGEWGSDGRRGISSLWLSSDQEKYEAGEILTELSIIENNTSTELRTIRLRIPDFEHDFLPNFRPGDVIILYERNTPEDNVTNRQIFKGILQMLTPDELTIRVRYRQRNPTVLPLTSRYAVEHDYLDSSYTAMYRGLYSFLKANDDRKQLLLNERLPEVDASVSLTGDYSIRHGIESGELNPIVLKARQAKDYFLLIGPPGTGKTSVALKSMVEEFYSDAATNILLLAYTNRAVDEICDALENAGGHLHSCAVDEICDALENAGGHPRNRAVDEICDALENVGGHPPYIRIGSEFSCEMRFRNRLLEKVIAGCVSREEVTRKIQQHRIFVGTVASLTGKTELFKLKHFEVAIIDEASQILEPALLGILSAKSAGGSNAIGKFILIGDHKQLPAIVLQDEKESATDSEMLHRIGLFDRRNSLFERLYHLHKNDNDSPLWSMLHKQGRMHPAISEFPNIAFYNGKLETVPTAHQAAELEYTLYDDASPVQKMIATKRLAFIPSAIHPADKTAKTNTYEAQLVKELVMQIYKLYALNGLPFSADKSLGVITPYRSQIALIKREIYDLGIPELTEITVDTVERFQGSQRDIIIYSVSVNQLSQLDFLLNTVEDEGQLIDRKLNVAITRAKKQLFVTANPAVLSDSIIYSRFIKFMHATSSYITTTPGEFLQGKFKC